MDETALKTPPLTLDESARQVVHEIIVDHCRVRKWELLALNVRTNHVHVVVYCGEDASPEKVMSEFKSWTTRRLRETGIIASDLRPWTRHGSTRWINDPASLDVAIVYVMEGQ